MKDKFFVWFIVYLSSFIICTSCENAAFTGVVGNPDDNREHQYIYTDNGNQTQDKEISAGSLEDAFEQIADDPQDSINYIIDLATIRGELVNGDELYYIAPVAITYPGVESVRVSLVNTSTTRKVITLKKTDEGGAEYTTDDLGSLFTVSTASLSIDGEIVLDGVNSEDDGIDNIAPLVTVNSGYLELKGSARIENNTNAGTGDGAKGGGVYLYLSTLDMDGDAAVVKNSAAPAAGTAEGGGIYAETSSLKISGNAGISDNKALGGNGSVDSVDSNTFIAEGITIKAGDRYDAIGGGICIADHSFLFISGDAAVKNNKTRGISFSATYPGGAGGGIAMTGTAHNSYCIIQLSGNVSVSENTALGYNCTGISVHANTGAVGGGISLREKSGLTISGNVQVMDNTAQAGNLSTSDFNKCSYAEGGGIAAGAYQYLNIIIEDNVRITDNKAIAGLVNNKNIAGMWTKAYGRGGGIVTGSNSAFTMTGGEISGNSAIGGGVEGEVESGYQTAGEYAYIYSRGGGIYINDSQTTASISGGLIENNIAGAPGLGHYGCGGAIYLGCSGAGESQLILSGSIRIPTKIDSTDDTEDSRNSIASARFYNSDGSNNDNPYTSNIYILPFDTDELIMLDVASCTPIPSTGEKVKAGTLENFLKESTDPNAGARILWYDAAYPNAAQRPPLPVRFALGDFIEYYTGNFSKPSQFDPYRSYKYIHTPLDGYKISRDGKMEAE